MELWHKNQQECSDIDLRSKDNPLGPPHNRRELQQYWSYIGKFAASLSEREERATVQMSLFVGEKEAFFLIPSKSLIESEKAFCTSCLEKQPLTSMFAINFGLKAAFQLSWSLLSLLLVCCRLPPSQHTICDVMRCWLEESAGADSFRQNMCNGHGRRRPWEAAT